jgi:hypothetical protein
MPATPRWSTLFGAGLQKVADVKHESLGLAIELVSESVNGVLVPKWSAG